MDLKIYNEQQEQVVMKQIQITLLIQMLEWVTTTSVSKGVKE
jgi:hypothetical protein